MAELPDDLSTVVESLPRETREVFEDLLAEPLVSLAQLREDIESYRQTVDEKGHEYEFMDTELAQAIADRYLEALARIEDDLSERERRLIQAGIRYFIESHDAADDFQSPIGFDDDRRVADAILDEVDRT